MAEAAQKRAQLKLCPECGREFALDVNFCPADGTALPDVDTHIGSVLLDQIEIEKPCGHGSMGTVYRAWQRTMERKVAVKILKRELLRDSLVVRRFRREARAAARLSHPNIITVYLVGDTDDGLPFLVMEFVEGRSLEQIVVDEGALPPVRAMHIARQIACALSEAHHQHIVHRDLKPANILLTDKRGAPDFVKVLDFGIAKILRSSDESQLTQTGAIFGTPYYLSPEQASGEDVDHRCDIYSLGVILFRMVTGELPFDADSGMEVLVKHLKDEPPAPSEIRENVPPALERVILKAMAKDPAARYQSGDELGDALLAVGETLYGGGDTLMGMLGDRDPSNPKLEVAGSAKSRRKKPSSTTGPVHLRSPTGAMTLDERKQRALSGAKSRPESKSRDRFAVPSDTELAAEVARSGASEKSDDDELGEAVTARHDAARSKDEPADDAGAGAEGGEKSQPSGKSGPDGEALVPAPLGSRDEAWGWREPDDHGGRQPPERTAQVALLDDPASSMSSTLRMQRRVVRRRRIIVHTLLAVVSIALGSTAGAFYYFHESHKASLRMVDGPKGAGSGSTSAGTAAGSAAPSSATGHTSGSASPPSSTSPAATKASSAPGTGAAAGSGQGTSAAAPLKTARKRPERAAKRVARRRKPPRRAAIKKRRRTKPKRVVRKKKKKKKRTTKKKPATTPTTPVIRPVGPDPTGKSDHDTSKKDTLYDLVN